MACSGEAGIETVFDPCSPLTVVPGKDTTTLELQSIEDAIDAWSTVLPTQLQVGAPGENPAGGVRIVFESGDTFFRAMYFDAIGQVIISRENLAEADYAQAITHELGHAFGLFHVSPDTRSSVMNVGNLDVAPTAEDAAEVRALWEACE